MSNNFMIGASVAALAAACASPGLAQTRGAAKDDSSVVLQELVVTAQKREERLQDVPISVAAISGESLASQGVNDTTDLKYLVPGLNFAPSASTRGEGFSIRGIGTAAFSDSIEQSVATVVDGVSYARTGQAVADLVDVARVEVLRGPQGFLFGKNASAGVISITTHRPEFKSGFQGKVSYATHDELKLEAVGNAAITDQFAVRIAYGAVASDGVIQNILRHENLNDRDSKSLRGEALWEPSADTSVLVIADWNQAKSSCCAWTYRSAPASSLIGSLSLAAGVTPSETNRDIAADQRFHLRNEASGLSVELNHNFGWATLTSVTAVRGWKNQDNNDPDLLPINYLNVNSGRGELVQKSEELRLTSPSGEALEWIFGLYADRIQNQTSTEQSGRLLQGFLPAGAFLGNSADSTTVNRSLAAFGQASYRLTDKLKVLAGARYTQDVLMVDFRSFATPGALAPFAAVGLVKGRTETTNLSGRLTLQYDVNDDVMGYVSAARGYKGPGLNILGTTGGIPGVVDPEIPTAYEAGLRSKVFGAAFVNVTAFTATYKDYQAQVFDQTLTPATFRITNAGSLKTQGVELEVLARPAADTLVTLSAAYIDAKYEDFKNLSCYLGQTQLPLGTVRTSPRQCIVISGAQAVTYGDGLPLTNQPKVTYALGVQQTWRIADFKLDGRLTWSWRDKAWFTPNGDPGTVQAAYGLLGGSLTLAPEQGPWTVSLFAKNLLDKHYASLVFPSPVLGAAGVYAQFIPPEAQRIVCVSLAFKY